MPHRRSHRVKSRRGSRSRSRTISRSYKGGNYSSASSYGSYVNGSGDAQFNRVFAQGGDFAGRQSNISIGAQGQNAQIPGVPTQQNMSLVQSAGKRTRRKRGGFLGSVINQAVVPFSILAMQQSYRNKKGGKTHRR